MENDFHQMSRNLTNLQLSVTKEELMDFILACTGTDMVAMFYDIMENSTNEEIDKVIKTWNTLLTEAIEWLNKEKK